MHLVLAGELGLVWTEFKKRRRKGPPCIRQSATPAIDQSQNVSRNPTCSRRMAFAVRMTPNVVDVAPDGTAAPG